jgi:Methyladenine glycosylase
MPNAQPKRCSWVNVDQVLMREYHDREWGVPVHDDPRHFEFLILEAAQAGLSWSIVLKKREGYRRIQRLQSGEGRSVLRGSDRQADHRSRDHPESPEDRRRGQERSSVSGGAGGVRQLRRVLLAIRRRSPATESLENHASDPRHDARVRRVQPRSEAAGIQLRGIHRHVRPHAGGRDGQRPSHGLFSISRRSAARHEQQVESDPRR